ncbi:hypothetical protein [uncultured Shewanella sp.]|uniref:hypothetical protein n=1 Tax=uncultured Shewanella sp. TaxID=173975 RepID=UPI00262E5564|nr:hypothetical protein [uncultured Shewanella sp.]
MARSFIRTLLYLILFALASQLVACGGGGSDDSSSSSDSGSSSSTDDDSGDSSDTQNITFNTALSSTSITSGESATITISYDGTLSSSTKITASEADGLLIFDDSTCELSSTQKTCTLNVTASSIDDDTSQTGTLNFESDDTTDAVTFSPDSISFTVNGQTSSSSDSTDPSDSTNPYPVTAYILLTDSGSLEKLHELATEAEAGTDINFNRLNIAFAKPIALTYSTDSVSDNNTALINDGILSQTALDAYPSFDFKSDVTALKNAGIQVMLSIGGWNYSQCTEASIANCDDDYSHFPLSPDVTDSSISIPYSADIQETDADFSDIIKSWAEFASAFGIGLDIDYEENWYQAEYLDAYNSSLLQQEISYGAQANVGPYVIPEVVEKLGFILQEVEEQMYTINQANNTDLPVTIAGSAVGAFNIHTDNGDAGNLFWYTTGTGTTNTKGLYYDLLHMKDTDIADFEKYYQSKNDDGSYSLLSIFEKFPYLLLNSSGASSQALTGLNSLGVMTYDLDDGAVINIDGSYQGYWCIGTDSVGSGTDCSIASQTSAIITMYRTMYDDAGSDNVPYINMGVEIGIPNYPIKADEIESSTTSGTFPWNDEYLVYDIPVISTDGLPSYGDTPVNSAYAQDGSTTSPHAYYLNVNADDEDSIFQVVGKNEGNGTGADGVIFWELNNPWYNYDISNAGDCENDPTGSVYCNYVSSEGNGFDIDYFGLDASNNGYTQSQIESVFSNAATEDDILTHAMNYFSSTQ